MTFRLYKVESMWIPHDKASMWIYMCYGFYVGFQDMGFNVDFMWHEFMCIPWDMISCGFHMTWIPYRVQGAWIPCGLYGT